MAVADIASRLDQLRRLFGEELVERLETLNATLSDLSLAWTGGKAAAMRRELHSLKGAARAAEAPGVEYLAHAAESSIPDGEPTPGWFEAVRGALGAMPGAFADPSADIRGVIAELTPHAEPPKPRKEEAVRATSPAAAGPQSASPKVNQASDQGSVRVSLAKLDALLTESGELSVTQLRITERLNELRELQRDLEAWQRDWAKTRALRARLRRASHRSNREAEALLRAADRGDAHLHEIVQRTRELVADLAQNRSQLATVATAIGEEVMAIRLLPAGTMFAPFERLVRDLSRQIGKDARLELVGSQTELDRRILDELRDPLMHMVRNSLDHGLESPAERISAGKPAEGRIKLSAAQRGDRVHILIEDDGRGLDLEAIRATAIRRNLLTAERAESIENGPLIDLIFHPGFSTRTAVSEISGRGV